MYILFIQFIEGTLPAIISLMPNFDNVFTLFLNKVNEINVLTGNQLLNRDGSAVEKNIVKAEISSIGGAFCGKMMGYAINEENHQLYSEVHYTEAGLLAKADTICHASCLIIWNKAKDNIAALASYGMVQADVDAFKAAIDLFELTMPRPKAGIVDKKAATENLKVAFGEASVLLTKLTRLSSIIKKEQPDFVLNFENTRRIDHPGYTTISCIGKVVDVDGAGVGLVTIECKALNIKRKAASSGGFYLKNMQDGVYDFTFTRPGYQKTIFKMIFYKGTRFRANVVMLSA